MSNNDELGTRMKDYEMACRTTLTRRLPLIIRLDGKSFHQFTKGCAKPFDSLLIEALNQTGIALCSAIQGAQIVYLQSDELTVLIHNYKRLESTPWFNNEIQKMVSVAAGIASATMTKESISVFGKIKPAVFDARAFVLPEAEVCNAFLWRQNDAVRNSVQMLARSMYSDKQCFKKSCLDLQDMTLQKGFNWNELPTHQRRGRCVVKKRFERNGQIRSMWGVDDEIPIFSQDRQYINKFLQVDSLELADKE